MCLCVRVLVCARVRGGPWAARGTPGGPADLAPVPERPRKGAAARVVHKIFSQSAHTTQRILLFPTRYLSKFSKILVGPVNFSSTGWSGDLTKHFLHSSKEFLHDESSVEDVACQTE